MSRDNYVDVSNSESPKVGRHVEEPVFDLDTTPLHYTISIRNHQHTNAARKVLHMTVAKEVVHL